MRRLIWPLIFGIGGVAILVSLGVWQVQRLAWKEAVLADIGARIAADPVAVPGAPDPEADRYLPVEAEGRLVADPIRVLVSQRGTGAGYRLIAAFDTGDRRLMADLGFLDADAAMPALPQAPVSIRGNLHWPEEVDGFTPDPDRVRNIWYARDVPALAEALDAQPILIIARAVSDLDPSVEPLPVDTSGIPNDHLNYAITWFSLAALWLGMTLYLLWRIRRRTV